MADLGNRMKNGTLDAENPLLTGGWTVVFHPQDTALPADYIVYHIAILGPPGSSFRVYIDRVFYSNVARGDINEFDPSQPMYVRRGQSLFFYWNTAAGNRPQVSIFCREPSPL